MENRGFGWLIKYDVVYWNDSGRMGWQKSFDSHVRAFTSISGTLKLFQLCTFKLSLHQQPKQPAGESQWIFSIFDRYSIRITAICDLSTILHLLVVNSHHSLTHLNAIYAEEKFKNNRTKGWLRLDESCRE